jgi:hypothetical protein
LRPLLHLSRNSTEINAAVNHPAVRPHLGMPDVGNLDLSESVAKPENIFPIGEHGGFALIWTAPFAREVHTFISPEGRGAWARNAAREGIEMARECGTRLLWTRIPPEGPNVRVFAALMGMAPTGEVISTFGTPYAIYSMEVK